MTLGLFGSIPKPTFKFIHLVFIQSDSHMRNYKRVYHTRFHPICYFYVFVSKTLHIFQVLETLSVWLADIATRLGLFPENGSGSGFEQLRPVLNTHEHNVSNVGWSRDLSVLKVYWWRYIYLTVSGMTGSGTKVIYYSLFIINSLIHRQWMFSARERNV